MPQDNKLKKFYDNLTEDGYKLGTYDEFRTKMFKDENRAALYNNLKEDGYAMPDPGTYNRIVSSGLSDNDLGMSAVLNRRMGKMPEVASKPLPTMEEAAAQDKAEARQQIQDLFKKDAFGNTKADEIMKGVPTPVTGGYDATKKTLDDVSTIVAGVLMGLGHGTAKTVEGLGNVLLQGSSAIVSPWAMFNAPQVDEKESRKLGNTTQKVLDTIMPDYEQNKEHIQGMSPVAKFVGNALTGMAEFLPAMVAAPATGGTSLYFNAYQSALDETKDKKMDPAMRQSYAMLSGGIFAALNEIPIGRALNKTIADKVVGRLAAENLSKAISDAGGELSYKVLNNALTKAKASLADKVKTLGVQGLKNLAEGATFTGADLLSKTLLQKGVNKEEGRAVFEAKKPKDYLQELISGTAAIGIMQAMTGGFSRNIDTYLKERVAKAKKPEDLAEIHNQIDGLSTRGTITPEKAKDMHEAIDSYGAIKRTLPEDLTDEQQAQSFDLIRERNQLNEQGKKLQELQSQTEQGIKGHDESGNPIPMEPSLITIKSNAIQKEIDQLNLARQAQDDKIVEVINGRKMEYGKDADGAPYKQVEGMPETREEISPEYYEMMAPEEAPKPETKPEETPKAETPNKQPEPKTETPAKGPETKTQEEPAEAPKPEPEPKKKEEYSPTFFESEGKVVEVRGERGVLEKEGQSYVVNTPKRIHEIGNADELKDQPLADHGVKPDADQVTANEDGSFDIRGNTYHNKYSDPMMAINHDGDGNVQSVNLEMADGKKRTFRGDAAEEIAYQITLKELNKNNSHEEFERFLNEPEIRKELDDAEVSETPKESTDESNASVSLEKERRKREQSLKNDNNAVQEQKTGEGVLRNEGVPRESELQRMEPENKKETPPKEEISIFEDTAENKHANGKLTEKDNPEQEPDVKGVERKAETARETAEVRGGIKEADELRDKALDVQRVKVNDLHTDEKRFQGRQGLNEKVVNRIAENWNNAEQDPIQVWRDPKDGKLYVLSGHHRLEAAKRAHRNDIKIIDRSNDFNEKQAIKFATEEANANRTMETPLERAATLRKKRENGDKDTKEFLEREGKNANYVENLSYLNPDGKTIDALKSMENAGDRANQKEIEKIADWVGATRKANKRFTDVHENEMFDFLMDKNASKRIKNRADFIHKAVTALNDFDPSEPLNLKRFKYKSEGEDVYEQEVNDLKNEILDRQNKIDEINQRFSDPKREDYISTNDPDYKEVKDLADKKRSELNKEIKGLQKKLQDLYKKKGQFTENNQGSLFNVSGVFKPVKRRVIDRIGKAISRTLNTSVNVLEKKDFDRAVDEAKKGKFNFIGEQGAWERIHRGLSRARDWDVAGISPELIFKKTGWYKDIDGEWKYELPNNANFLPLDKESGFNKKFYTAKLGEVLDYPELYKAYPELKDVEVRVENLDKDTLGRFNVKNKIIHLNGDISKEKQYSTLRHEIQHYIQSREKFGRGASPTDGRKRVDQEIRRMDAKKRQIEAYLASSHAFGYNGDPLRNDLAIINEKIADLKSNYDSYANYFYRAYAGEIEARNVQERLKNPKLREKIPTESADKFPKDYITVDKVKFLHNKDGIYGFAHNGKIYLNGERLNRNTPIHEASHLFNEWAKENAPDLHRAGMEFMAGSEYLKSVKRTKFYQDQAKRMKDQGASDADIEAFYRDEALARAVGDAGEKMTGSLKNRFKNWVKTFWERVKSALGKGTKIENMTVAQFKKMTMNDFAETTARRLLSGEKLKGDKPLSKGKGDIRFQAEEKSAESPVGDFVEKQIKEAGKDAKPEDIKKRINRLIDDNLGDLPKQYADNLKEEAAKMVDRKIAESKLPKELQSAIAEVPSGRKKANTPEKKAEHYSEVLGSKPSNAQGEVKVDPILGVNPGDAVDIITRLSKKLKTKIRKLKTGRAGGSYSPSNGSIKIKYDGDLEVTAHELGHQLDDKFKLTKEEGDINFERELDNFVSAVGSRASKLKEGSAEAKLKYRRGEGLAEWMRAYVKNPKEAIALAPHIYERYVKNVPENIRKVVGQFSEDFRAFHGMSALDRTKAHIQMETDKEPNLMQQIFKKKDEGNPFAIDWVDKLAANWVDPLRAFQKAADYLKGIKGLEEVLPANDPYLLARLFLSADRRYSEALEKGIRNHRGEFYLNDAGEKITFNSLFEHMDNTDKKSQLDDIKNTLAYMASERVVELSGRFGRKDLISGVGGGTIKDLKDAHAVLKEIKEGDPKRYERIKKSAQAYRDFADATLKYMVEEGRLSKEQYNLIKENNLQYVAFNRIKNVAHDEPIVVIKKNNSSNKLGLVKEPLKKVKGSTEKLKNPYVPLLENLHTALKEADRNNVMRAFRDLLVEDRGLHEGEPVPIGDVAVLGKRGDKNSIPIFVDGKAEYWVFQPDLYKSIKGMTDAGFMFPPIVTFLPRLLRGSVVNFPIFQLRNITRDTFDRILKSNTGSGFKHFAGEKADWEDIAHFGGLNSGYYMRGQEAYYAYMKLGTEKLLKKHGVFVTGGDALKRGWKGYQSIMEKGETLNRVAEYRSAFAKAKKMGYDDYNASLYAAFHARDLMDFALQGYQMRWINQLVPFSNAALQGIRSSVKSAVKNPAGFAMRMMINSVAPQAALWLFNHRNEEISKIYEEIPDWQRDLYWNIVLGDNMIISIPKPYELGMLASAVDRGMSKATGWNDKAYDGYAGQVAQAMSPISDWSALAGPYGAIFQATANKDFFRDKHIVPTYEEKLDLSLRNTQYASRLGKAVQEVAGLDARKVDFLTRSMFSYYGNLALKLSDVGRKDKNDKFGLRDLGFFKNTPAYNAKSVQEMITYAGAHKKTGTKEYRQFRMLANTYFEAKTNEQKEQLAKDLREYAKHLLDTWKNGGGPTRVRRK